MGNIASNLQNIAGQNCAATYSFTFNGRGFPIEAATKVANFQVEAKANTAGLINSAFNNDLTDCVEVYTPASIFSHLGNGQGLFKKRSAVDKAGMPQSLNPIFVKAILEGLEEFQDKISTQCDEANACIHPVQSCLEARKRCLIAKRKEVGVNYEFERCVENAINNFSHPFRLT